MSQRYAAGFFWESPGTFTKSPIIVFNYTNNRRTIVATLFIVLVRA